MRFFSEVNQVQQQVQAAADSFMIANYVEQRRNQFPSFDDSTYSDDSDESDAHDIVPVRYQSSRSSPHSSRGTRSVVTAPGQIPPASTLAITGLTHIRVFPDDKVAYKSDDRCCSICSEPLIDGVVLTRLPCGHIYHISCIVPWLKRSCTCPDCRYELPTADRAFEAGRQERMKGRKVSSCGCPSHGFHSCVFPVKGSES